MTFAELNLTTALHNALDELGYTKPTTIQKAVFPPIMAGQNVCGIAQTGTGKTIAYLLPLLRLWKFTKEKAPEILIVVPTRELVVQIVETTKELTKYMHVEVVGVYGGVNINTQKLLVEKKVDVLVATPGRLFDLAMNGSLKLKRVKKFVIDEVDEMLNLGFRTQLKNIIELLPTSRQSMFFSATITDEVAELMNNYVYKIVTVEAAPTGTPLQNIHQQKYELPNYYTKVNMLKLLLAETSSMTKVLIFVATKKLADELFEQLQPIYETNAGVIHSNKEQNHRFNTVESFKNGTYRFIIATDIIARGIDVAEVTHVINFDIPDVVENYMHRIGRTGRADKNGEAISFVTPTDENKLANIEIWMNHKIESKLIPDNLEISEKLTADEMPKVFMKEIQLKIPKKEERGAAFHEKSAKNKKVNFTTSRKEKMMKKYGKPKTRGQKKKGK